MFVTTVSPLTCPPFCLFSADRGRGGISRVSQRRWRHWSLWAELRWVRLVISFSSTTLWICPFVSVSHHQPVHTVKLCERADGIAMCWVLVRPEASLLVTPWLNEVGGCFITVSYFAAKKVITSLVSCLLLTSIAFLHAWTSWSLVSLA